MRCIAAVAAAAAVSTTTGSVLKNKVTVIPCINKRCLYYPSAAGGPSVNDSEQFQVGFTPFPLLPALRTLRLDS